MLDESYILTEVAFPNRIAEIGALRIRAWSSEPGIDPIFFSQRIWIDALDHEAHHWIVTLNNKIVASARMSFHNSLDNVPYASLLPAEYCSRYENRSLVSINRLVVDPQFRGRGLAKVLDNVRLTMAIDKGVDVILAQPQLSRLAALDKLGFSYLCELPPTPELPGRPLFFMELDLTK
ncbi:hypothetical protein GCM10028809_19190 [Spirosoma gilvum]